MLNFLFGVAFAVLTVLSWALLETYQRLPLHELKRRVRHGDDTAKVLYRAAAYGTSLQVLLTVAAMLWGALSLVTFTWAVGLEWAIVLLLAFLLSGLFAVTSRDKTGPVSRLAVVSAPSLAWMLERLHTTIDRGVRLVRRYRHVSIHTGLYETSDLLRLLELQKDQPDSRISSNQLELLQHAVLFEDKQVSSSLVPLRVVGMVAASDAIGPILMDELARSGHSRFPVYEGKRGNIVGILYLHDLVTARQGGTVADVMSPKLTYVHEDFSLQQALQAFLKTKRHLFLVVNGFEEVVGIITIEDVLEQIIGKPIMDEFDAFDDMRAVAAAAAKREHAAHQKDKAEPVAAAESTPEPKEMVE